MSINCEFLGEHELNPKLTKVLIIDDSKLVNDVITKEFNKLGYQTVQTYDLGESLEVIANQKIDIIILDLHLPDGEGERLVFEIQRVSKAKIVIITAESDYQVRENLFKFGVIDYVVKDDLLAKWITDIDTTLKKISKNRSSKILVIDDSKLVHTQLKMIFEQRDYQVLSQYNGKEAIAFLEENSVDVILLDMELPDIHGSDLLKLIKKSEKIQKCAIIPLSGSSDPKIISKVLKNGANDYIRKPYIVEELVLKVDLWIENHKKDYELVCKNKILDEYKLAIDRSAIVSKTNARGIITYVNDKFIEISGYSYDELIGKPHNIIRHPDMKSETFKEMWETLLSGKVWEGNVKNLKKDGGFYIVKTFINPIIDAEGEIVEFIAMRYDITELEMYKENLHENLQTSNNTITQYEDAIESSSAIARVDLNLIITYVNSGYTNLSQYSYEEMVGRPILDFVAQESLFLAQKAVETIANGEVFQDIFKGIAKNGKPYYTKTTIKPLKNMKNEIQEYLLIKNDVTEEINLQNEIIETQREVVATVGAIGETRSKETGQHVHRVAEYSYLLAKLYGLSDEDASLLKQASPMHDIGKVGIPDDILNKPGKLTPEEFDTMKTHSRLGYEMLRHSKRPILRAAATVASQHHEKWNGQGYPNGLNSERIHIFGRITAIVDVFDALGHDRVYKKAWPLQDILDLIKKERGVSFDPTLVDIFFENLGQFLEIKASFDEPHE